MTNRGHGADEKARLRALESLKIIDTPSEAEFDHIVQLASLITGCPVSLLTLVDETRQWFKAKVGTEVSETPREISFCTHTIQAPVAYIVDDAASDPLFQNNPLVVNDPKIRFYAGHPLITAGGHRIGTLCAIDVVPRVLTSTQIDQLGLLARQAVRMMELRISNLQLEQARSELVSLHEMADQANSAKSAFLANMSHEIRTPLGAIMGFADLAQQTSPLNEDATNFLSIIQRNSTQVLKIVDDILDLAKVEAGKVILEPLDISLVSFLAEFASLMNFRARENGIEFKIQALTDLPDHVSIDPTRVRQVLNNVVGNAIKFTQRGSVSLSVSRRNNKLEFKIEDTGRGISDEQAGQLFQAFVQADISVTRQYGGTGLGLILTKHLCQAMGGDFFLLKSEPGVGSCFIATLEAPISMSSRVQDKTLIQFDPEKIEAERANNPVHLRGLKVLVVEDSPDNQKFLRILLEKQGILFSLAKNGAEGVERAMDEAFDVVLMDVQMPVMGGHEAVSYLRAHGYAKPIIALTAHAMKEEYERALRSGFTDYLSKPIHRSSLFSMISKYGAGV